MNKESTVNTFRNLPEEMQRDMLAKFRSKSRRIDNSPWHYFPNIVDFSIKLSDYEPKLLEIGIKKRLKPELKFQRYINQGLNRYLSIQISRLKRNRNRPKVYWTIAKSLMLRSDTFNAAAVHRVMNNWYKNYPLIKILSTMRKVRRIIKTNNSNFMFSRVYIPKPGKDRVRPLGVPTLEWRIVLHMWNNFIYWFIQDKLSPHQHAFQPTKGTLTAWKEFFRKKKITKNFKKHKKFINKKKTN
jgi:hypothetical protein